MSLITIFLVSFGLIFTAELGDKTQLMVLSLALRYGGRPVLAGAILAFALLSGSAALVGKGLGALLDQDGLVVVEIGHNREALERAFPRLPFTWLETSGGDGLVFLLTGAQLVH